MIYIKKCFNWFIKNGWPVKPGTIRKYVPGTYLENDRSRAEEVQPLPTTPQPSWAEIHPELAAKSSGSRVEDLPVVKEYKEDLAKRERAEKRKAEDFDEKTLKALKR